MKTTDKRESEAIDLEKYRADPIEPYYDDGRWFSILPSGHARSGCLINGHVYAKPVNYFASKVNLDIWPNIHLVKKDRDSKPAIIQAL